MAVLDWDAGNRIHIFDGLGAWIRSVGGKGSGPGEMQEAQGLAMDASGRLTVHDFIKGALIRWNADGTLMSELKISTHRGMPTSAPHQRGDTLLVTVHVTDSTTRTRRLERWTTGSRRRHDHSMRRPMTIYSMQVYEPVTPAHSYHRLLQRCAIRRRVTSSPS